MWRQIVSPDRLFMTFLETAAMNRQFKEAEAVLIGDPANRAFWGARFQSLLATDSMRGGTAVSSNAA
jgi:hypothetical protein